MYIQARALLRKYQQSNDNNNDNNNNVDNKGQLIETLNDRRTVRTEDCLFCLHIPQEPVKVMRENTWAAYGALS